MGNRSSELRGDVPQAVADVRRALAGESVFAHVGCRVRVRGARLAGRERDGSISGVVGVATDITERRRAEQALRRADSRQPHAGATGPSAFSARPEGAFLSVNRRSSKCWQTKRKRSS